MENKNTGIPPPKISRHLLWEYDLANFDFNRSKKVVIERVVARGNLEDWQEMARFYTKEEILHAVSHSKQLGSKEKSFTPLFLQSGFLDPYVF